MPSSNREKSKSWTCRRPSPGRIRRWSRPIWPPCATPPTANWSPAISPASIKYPLVLGHESTGIVQAVGPRVRNFQPGQRVIGGLLFDFSDPRFASGWGGFCDYTLVNDHDAMVADGVADAAHGWLECYEIQRPGRSRYSGSGSRAVVHLAGSVGRFRRFQPPRRRRDPGVRRRAGGAELRQVRPSAGARLGGRGRSAASPSAKRALAMGGQTRSSRPTIRNLSG